jgi:CubicO group peptidase (beta-lactamase class C family)
VTRNGVALIEERLRANRVPGLAAAVVGPEGVRSTYGFGVTDLERREPVDEHTPFLWFSMTKIATATAAMRLNGLGLLDLDAPVSTYYPPFAMVRQRTAVTVRQLLSHSSGLANPVPIRWVRPADTPPPDPAAWIERLLSRHRRLRSEPGTRTRYSNLGYLVLGEVIARVAGEPYEEHLRNALLAPLGMAHTGFSYEVHGAPAATGYQPVPAGLTPLVRAVLPSGMVAGRHHGFIAYRPFYVLGAAYGGLVGGVLDAARLVQLHLNDGAAGDGRILPPGAAAQMRQLTPRGGSLDVGLGWYRFARDTGPFVEHLGGGSGFWNAMRLYPDAGVGLVLMGNVTRYDHGAILSTLADV